MYKKLLFVWMTAVSVIVSAQIQGYNLNDTVSDFTVTDIEGNTHTLYEYTAAGKYVYLDFFFDTCGPCQATAPIFNEFYDIYGCGAGQIMCLSINNGTDTDAEVEAFEETYGGSFHHAPAVSMEGGAGAVNADFNPAAYPTICLISPDNKIINLDIWPVSGVETFEQALPADVNPEPQECTVGVDEAASVDVLIYPNPLSDDVLKVFSPVAGEMTVTNLLGEEVMSAEIHPGMNEWYAGVVPGTYFIKIDTPEGYVVKKLVVK